MKEKVMKLLCAITAALAFAAVAPSVQATNRTITQIVAASGGTFDNNQFDYDILLNAVVTANLADALNDPNADLTVFAPNDRAFKRLASDLGWAGGNEESAWNFLVGALTDLGAGDPIPVLTAVLTYHVVPESLNAFQVLGLGLTGQSVETLQGGTIRFAFIRLIDKDPDFINPKLFLPLNVRASNGIIHTIDRVLLPIDLP